MRSREPFTFRALWSLIVEIASAEWLLTRLKYANGGDIILLRSLFTAGVVYLVAIGTKNLLDPSTSLKFDWHVCRAQLSTTVPWFGAIFAGVYATLHSRYASQWTYLANVYNRVKETEARGVSIDVRKMAEWKAGFIEDAEDLHLVAKPMFASVVRFWATDAQVKSNFIGLTVGGQARWRALSTRLSLKSQVTPITAEFASRFADEWIAAWNAHDLPRVLSHYEDDFEMASPLIVEIAGELSGVLHGKKNVGAYWEKALRLIADLHFEKLGVFVGARSLAIHFRNQEGRLSVETFEIGESGRVTRSAAHHG